MTTVCTSEKSVLNVILGDVFVTRLTVKICARFSRNENVEPPISLGEKQQEIKYPILSKLA